MRAIKYLTLMFSAAVLFTGCFENDYQTTFSDNNAFVAFQVNTLSVDESAGSLQIPVILSSASQLSGTVTIEVDKVASTAVAGENFVDPGTITLTFPGGDVAKATQYITLNVIDNDIFTGNTTVEFRIVSAEGKLAIGNQKVCSVTIVDDEHPLKDYLGTLTMSTTAAAVYSVTAEAIDLTKISLTNFPISVGNSLYHAVTMEIDLEAKTAVIFGQTDINSNFGPYMIGAYAGTDTSNDYHGIIAEDGSIQFTGSLTGIFTSGTNVGVRIMAYTNIKLAK